MKLFVYAIAALAVALLGFTDVASAGAVAQFTGPSGTNPAANAVDQADMNALVNALNPAIGPGSGGTGLFTNGSIGGTFQSQGLLKTSTSLTTGTLLPYVAGSTTVKFFLTFVDSQGIQSFIPVWQ